MAAYAPTSYVGDGVEDTYAVGFDFVRKAYVKVTVDSVSKTFTWASASTLTLDEVPADQSAIDIYRETPLNTRVVNFEDGASVPEADLDDSFDQIFHALEETILSSLVGMELGVSGHWDADSKRIENVAPAVLGTDAMNMNEAFSYLVLCLAAKTSAEAAETSATAQASAALGSATLAWNAMFSCQTNEGLSEEHMDDAETAAAAAEATLAEFAGLIGSGDAGKYIEVKDDESGYELVSNGARCIGAQLTSDYAQTSSNYHAIIPLSNLAPPGADGVKKFEVTLEIWFEDDPWGNGFGLHMGTAGNENDAKLLDIPFQTVGGDISNEPGAYAGARGFLHCFRIQPAADDKVSLAYDPDGTSPIRATSRISIREVSD